MLKSFVHSIATLFEALTGARAELLVLIRENCRPENIRPTVQFISEVINDDAIYSKQPIDLRNQRTYAVKVDSGAMKVRLDANSLPVWRQWSA